MVISIQPTIPFFEGNGYDTWSIKMRTLFISEDLWELVDKGYVEEEIPRDAMRDVRKNDAKALFFIQQAISESIFPQISKATKSKEAWDSLQTKYQSTSLDAAQDGDGSQTDIPLMDDSVYEAAAKGDIEALKKIPDKGRAFEGRGALINAAREPTLDIETGPGPHKVMLRMENKGKDTALHEAVRYWHYGVMELLIEEDPDFIYGANDSGITPLYMAVEGGFAHYVKLIIEKSSTSPSYNGLKGRTALHAAVICNDIGSMLTTLMIMLFSKDKDNTGMEAKPHQEVDKNGWSPLHYAAEGGDLEIVKLLLEKSEKSVAYLRSKDGKKTALHIASFHHHTKIVEEILSYSPGCREQVDDKGNNIFHFAMMKEGDEDFYPSSYFNNYWLRLSGLVNEKNAQGNTPIHLLSLNQIQIVILYACTWWIRRRTTMKT
ncbi:Ankyrin repeat-containing protein [Vitis vinifera]|uniref:Ankyrin repeat-containing protein n=1 Tax=Vitis vinifera TaxID=29760 RepID=A0A438G604_VITVI|nr:Ankyrin repeat-containing protein [Vitis vinifera]